MNDLKEILLGILVLIYGFVFYIMGRTNIIEKVIVHKLNEITKSLKGEDESVNDYSMEIQSGESKWEDVGISVAAKTRFGAKEGDVITLTPEEASWVEEDVIRRYGKNAQIKSIKDNMMICHLVFDLTK